MRGGNVACPASGSCETILSSGYASVFGIPLSLFGKLSQDRSASQQSPHVLYIIFLRAQDGLQAFSSMSTLLTGVLQITEQIRRGMQPLLQEEVVSDNCHAGFLAYSSMAGLAVFQSSMSSGNKSSAGRLGTLAGGAVLAATSSSLL